MPATKIKETFMAKYNCDKEMQWYENPSLPSEGRKDFFSREQLIHEIPLSKMLTLHNEKRPRVFFARLINTQIQTKYLIKLQYGNKIRCRLIYVKLYNFTADSEVHTAVSMQIAVFLCT